MVRLKVLEETRARQGIDYFGEGLSEVLFDTPSAIARVWRSRAGRRSLLVSAADTVDPNGRRLRFHWALLRGDPARVRITPLGPRGRQARIEVDWQDPQPTPGAPDITSHRVDIGVFANNGTHDSAPAFISILVFKGLAFILRLLLFQPRALLSSMTLFCRIVFHETIHLVAHLCRHCLEPSWMTRVWYCSRRHMGQVLRPEKRSNAAKHVYKV